MRVVRQMDSSAAELDVLLNPVGRAPQELFVEKGVSGSYLTRCGLMLSRRSSKNSAVSDGRSGLFATDPQVRKYDAERVLCKICETWIPLSPTDDAHAIQTWLQHRTTCLQSRPTPISTTSTIIVNAK